MNQPLPPPGQPQQPKKKAWWKEPKMIAAALAVIVAGFFIVKSLTADPFKDVKSGACINGDRSDVKVVDCDSPQAAFKIGSNCEVIIEVSKGGKEDSFCAEKLD